MSTTSSFCFPNLWHQIEMGFQQGTHFGKGRHLEFWSCVICQRINRTIPPCFIEQAGESSCSLSTNHLFQASRQHQFSWMKHDIDGTKDWRTGAGEHFRRGDSNIPQRQKKWDEWSNEYEQRWKSCRIQSSMTAPSEVAVTVSYWCPTSIRLRQPFQSNMQTLRGMQCNNCSNKVVVATKINVTEYILIKLTQCTKHFNNKN